MFETKQLHRNGGLVVMETSGVPFFDGSGTLLGYRGVARDVTERRQLVSELANKTRELESFVYTVSHDLKAPLVSLGGFSSLLVNRYGDMLDADGRHYLERIQANTAHMGRMIAELLELSRIGRVVGDRSVVNMDELAAKVREDLRPELELRNIDLRILSPLPRPVADRDRIAQVLENLFSNAIQFMGDQQEPAIEAGSSGQQSGKYLFFVRDNGIGIEPEYHEKIFQLFQRLNDIDTDGTGIGLAIVKRVIEHHGGRIWVESRKGAGSTFFFTLPAE
jgi:signal transduction histidine kinase